ncbi:MAG TPA: 3D domain-containing protein [Gaiellaceae bacterium]|nr:3D domain-containing protein [Gaiellaceae bacterium]
MAVFAGGLLAVAVLAGGAAGSPPGAAALRKQEARTEARHRAAVLSLFSLETQLTRTRDQLASVRSRSSAARREGASVRLQLRIAKRALTLSEHQLCERLRALYMAGDTDPIAVILGSSSLDEMMTGLDGIASAAEQNRSVIAQTRSARGRLTRMQHALAVKQAELTRLEAAAAQTAGSLEQAAAQRRAYVRSLEAQQGLTRTRIAALDQVARAADTKAATLTPSGLGPPGAVPQPGQTMTVSVTAYSLPGFTSSGLPVGWGVAAVDTSLIPFGTRFFVPGYGETVAADHGTAIMGPRIDIWFPTLAQAQAWGRRTVVITFR